MARVSRSEIDKELDRIEAIVADHPNGLSRADLEDAFVQSQGRRFAWRTLLRRLDDLTAQGRVQSEGQSTATVYRPGPGLVLEAPPPEEGYVPLSREGARVRALVRRPMTERTPVGYRRDFLDAYEPRRTWYLPRALRDRLRELGRAADGRRRAGTYARDVLGRLLIDLSWASSRLEGNTYSRLDTQNLIEFGQRAEGKDTTEAQMILNHKAAIEFIVEGGERVGFDAVTFQNLHAILSENLVGDAADEGRIRTRPVMVSGTTYTPLAIPQALEELFHVFLAKADGIGDPIEQAFFVMVHLPYLQPFTDINKRTSRLGANLSLVKANLCPLSFVDVPVKAYVEATLGVYEMTKVDLLRDVFVWAYERSCVQYRVIRESLGEPDPLRLRYRAEFAEAVRDAVKGLHPPTRDTFRVWSKEHAMPAADLDLFTDWALKLLLELHEGSMHRYDLQQEELEAWRSQFKP